MAEMPKSFELAIVDKRIPAMARNVAVFLALTLIPIGLGKLIGSNAMEWVGFIIGMCLMIGWVTNYETNTVRYRSLQEARAALDEWEKKTNG